MTLKHLTVTVCILSLSFLLKSCNAEDIDSLNSQISELTEKIDLAIKFIKSFSTIGLNMTMTYLNGK